MSKKTDFHHKVQTHLRSQLPLALFSRVDEDEVTGVFQKNSEVCYLNDYEQSGFVLAPFDSTQKKILIRSDKVFRGSLSLQLIKASRADVKDVLGRDHHIHLVEKAIETIKKGDLQKVVVSRQIQVNVEVGILELFSNLNETYKDAFCYLFYHPHIGIWMGATPEQFLKLEAGRLLTHSLAGTLPFQPNKRPSWTNKEFQEQALVTEHIEKVLKYNTLTYETEGPFNKKAGRLWHLNSIIKADVPETQDLASVIEGLHPTPAVCGLPTLESRRFIQSFENYDRQFYTGFLGELNLGRKANINLFVNLRCLQVFAQHILIYVGGGITNDSDPEKEWAETVNKSKTMMDLLV